MKKIQSILIALMCTALVSCNDEQTPDLESQLPGDVAFTINKAFGSSNFALDESYTTPEGDVIKPSEIRYWVSNITLKNTEGTSYTVPGSYYLLQDCKEQVVQDGSFTMPATKRETVNIQGIPAGKYTELTFSIGVDSEYNDNLSLQAGELSIMQNMTNVTWMWHTSYIFTKLAGVYVKSGTESFNFIFETGTNEQYKTITKTFDVPIQINGLQPAEITLKADVSKLFAGIRIEDAALNEDVYKIGAGTPELMSKLSTNYSAAFELISVENVTRQ